MSVPEPGLVYRSHWYDALNSFSDEFRHFAKSEEGEREIGQKKTKECLLLVHIPMQMGLLA